MKKEEGAWRGENLGPYHVTLRHRGIGGGVGRLYEARNEETGNAALVLMPGPKGDLRPTNDWQVRATSSVTPPYLAFEVEKAPEGGQVKELTWMLGRWSMARVSADGESDVPLLTNRDKGGISPAARRPTTPEQDALLAFMRAVVPSDVRST